MQDTGKTANGIEPSLVGSTVAAIQPQSQHRHYVLGVLLLVYVVHHIDRNVLLVLLEPIGKEFALSDSQLGALSGLAYALPFALAGIPLGVLGDRMTRTRLLALLVLIWSAFTALAGFARGFTMLLFTRAAVGAAEAGAPPAMLSLLSDTYPPASRPAALSILYTGPLLGMLAGSLFGGIAAAAYGWRGALFIAAAPGVALSLLVLLTLREPSRGHFERATHDKTSAEPLKAVLRFAFDHAGVRATAIAMVFASLVSIGGASWVPTVLIRIHGLPVDKAGAATALAIGLPGGIGALVSGWIAAKYARGRTDQLLRLCGIALALSVPAGVLGALSQSTPAAIGCFALWSFASAMYIGPGHSLYLGWAAPRMRGTLAAIVIVACNLLGAGLGPQIVGSLSDGLKGLGDPAALSHSLAALAALGLIPAWLFLAAARRGTSTIGS